MVEKRIAIIPARGGSKRIPHKNIIDFCGKPMIAWTIQAAKNTGLFDRVLVSTDEQKIADIAIEWGGEAPFLRRDCADDFSPVSEATISALHQAVDYWGESYTSVVQLMANCPLRSAADINQAIHQFERNKRNFQISCFKYGWMNPWWAVKLDSNQYPQRLFPGSELQRSQDLDDLFCPTGAIWLARTENLICSKTFYGDRHAFEPLSWESAIDIDDYEDLRFAEIVYEKLSGYMK